MLGSAETVSSQNHTDILAAALSACPPPRAESSQVRRRNIWRPRLVASTVSPWADRVLAYQWKGDGYQELTVRLELIFADSFGLAQALSERPFWNADEQRLAIDLTSRVFAWGRAGSRTPVDALQVQAVFAAALHAAGVTLEQRVAEAPWSSGWTKVAAFATAHLDHDAHTAGHPQVILDSRVANAFRKLVERPKRSFRRR